MSVEVVGGAHQERGELPPGDLLTGSETVVVDAGGDAGAGQRQDVVFEGDPRDIVEAVRCGIRWRRKRAAGAEHVGVGDGVDDHPCELAAREWVLWTEGAVPATGDHLDGGQLRDRLAVGQTLIGEELLLGDLEREAGGNLQPGCDDRGRLSPSDCLARAVGAVPETTHQPVADGAQDRLTVGLSPVERIRYVRAETVGDGTDPVKAAGFGGIHHGCGREQNEQQRHGGDGRQPPKSRALPRRGGMAGLDRDCHTGGRRLPEGRGTHGAHGRTSLSDLPIDR